MKVIVFILLVILVGAVFSKTEDAFDELQSLGESVFSRIGDDTMISHRHVKPENANDSDDASDPGLRLQDDSFAHQSKKIEKYISSNATGADSIEARLDEDEKARKEKIIKHEALELAKKAKNDYFQKLQSVKNDQLILEKASKALNIAKRSMNYAKQYEEYEEKIANGLNFHDPVQIQKNSKKECKYKEDELCSSFETQSSGTSPSEKSKLKSVKPILLNFKHHEISDDDPFEISFIKNNTIESTNFKNNMKRFAAAMQKNSSNIFPTQGVYSSELINAFAELNDKPIQDIVKDPPELGFTLESKL